MGQPDAALTEESLRAGVVIRPSNSHFLRVSRQASYVLTYHWFYCCLDIVGRKHLWATNESRIRQVEPNQDEAHLSALHQSHETAGRVVARIDLLDYGSIKQL